MHSIRVYMILSNIEVKHAIDLAMEVLDCSRTFYECSIRNPKNVHSIRVFQ